MDGAYNVCGPTLYANRRMMQDKCLAQEIKDKRNSHYWTVVIWFHHVCVREREREINLKTQTDDYINAHAYGIILGVSWQCTWKCPRNSSNDREHTHP